MKSHRDPRHLQRIKLMRHLFSSSFRDRPDPVVKHVWEHLSVLDPLIAEAAPERPLSDFNPVDLAILRLSVFELVIDKSAPYKVIIDEAIELAKEFGSENSPAFINGALGQIIKQL